MLIIVGLGNPGREYSSNRHNVGFKCIDNLSHKWNIPLVSRRKLAVLGEGTVSGKHVILVKPRTFVNHSGKATQYLIDRWKTTTDKLLIIYDDMDLPLGKLRLKPSGGAAGHNGLLSIANTLRTQDIPRLRIGIGRPPTYTEEATYVLGNFTIQEKAVIKNSMDTAINTISCLLREDIQEAMNNFN